MPCPAKKSNKAVVTTNEYCSSRSDILPKNNIVSKHFTYNIFATCQICKLTTYLHYVGREYTFFFLKNIKNNPVAIKSPTK